MSDLEFIEKKGDIDFSFDDIHWLIDQSTKSDLLFIKGSKKSEELVSNNKIVAAYIITDSKKIFESISKGALVSSDNFLNVQKYYLDQKYPLVNKSLIGITGTNGKTTVSSVISQALFLSRKKVMLVGTLGVFLNGEQKENFYLTTPSFIDVRKILYKHRKDYDFAVFEMSSHALEQQRFYKIEFKIIGWTNLTQDHLDYHKTMENYFESKAKIINHHKEKKVYVSSLSEKYKKVLKQRASVIEVDSHLPEYAVKELSSGFTLKFNIENLALARAMLEGICDFSGLWNKFSLPDGRVNLYEYKGNKIIIDSAHTPGALREICSNLKEAFPKYRLITLFGCGGDRDRTKRPKMLKEVLDFSELVIVTSDNPRTEDPQQIIDSILIGREGNESILSIVDRSEAIAKGISILEGKDILLIAGKGHENYIIVGEKKLDYSDRRVVEKSIYD